MELSRKDILRRLRGLLLFGQKGLVAQNKRTDEQGRAFKGSQLQVQIYVNRRDDELNQAIFKALPDLKDYCLQWVSPIASTQFKEYRDNEFLDAVKLSCLSEKLATFWPKGGPVWDALAIAEGKTKGIILVEGKNYPEEMQSTCGATDENSLKLITYSLNKTKRWLGIPEETTWTSPLYQYVNRLAHLYFLRQECNVPAWMVNLCFLNDNIHHPTTCSEWKSELLEVRATLRLSNVKIPYHAEVFLEARPRSELLT